MSNLWSTTGESRQRFRAGSRQDIHQALRRLTRPTHVGHLYGTDNQRLIAAVPFIRIGIERNERCLFLTDDQTEDSVEREIAALAADIDTAIHDEHLQIVPRERFLPAESPAMDPLLARLQAAVEESKAAGFDGLRIAVNIPWGDEAEIDFDEYLEFKTEFDEMVSDDIAVLYQHDVRMFEEEALIDIAQLYPTIVFRGRVSTNPYYAPPATIEAHGKPALGIERLLDTAQDLATAREAVRQREQRVAVLNRVLRHNLRNEMNVVQSHAELIAERTDDETVHESLTTIQQTVDRLLELSEDARRVQEIGAGDVPNRSPVNLRRAGQQAVEQLRHNPHLDIDWEVEDIWVEGTEQLDVAFTELFTRLADVAEGRCTVTVSAETDCGPPGHCCLRVDGGDITLPATEVESVSNGIETPLTHSSGLGLWVVNWIVERSGGRLEFEDNGGTVVLSLPMIDAT